jgi:hypothetical protein
MPHGHHQTERAAGARYHEQDGKRFEFCPGAAVMFMGAAVQPAPPLPLAWQHTGEFWTQTAAAFVHHPLAILLCAAVPAAERGYVLGRSRHLGRRQLALLELLVTLWRVFLCAVAVWVATTGNEWRLLSGRVGALAAWQVALNLFGSYLAHHLRMLLWELLFLAAALLLAILILRWLVRLVALWLVWLRDAHHQRAVRSVLGNLILFPFTLIYLVEMARPVLR